MKRECIHWILGQLNDFHFWHHLCHWSWIFQGHILKKLYLRNCWSDWCETKGKQIIVYLADYVTLIFHHTHEVKIRNGLILAMGGPIDMERKECDMMTSSNGNIFRVTGHLCGTLMFSLICACINGRVNNRRAGDLRRHRTHYDVIIVRNDRRCYIHVYVCTVKPLI